MSTQTEHLNLDLREAADIFNPLSTNANFESLDNIIYEIQTKGGVPTYTTTASANLLKLSQNPTPNVTVFKFVAAGDANTWSYQETVNDIVALDGSKKTVKGGEMYVAWVNAANAMVVIAWPDVVNAQTFDGKGPDEWASKAQLDAVNQTAANATTTAQAAAAVANQALQAAGASGLKSVVAWTRGGTGAFPAQTIQLSNIPATATPVYFVVQTDTNNAYIGLLPYKENSVVDAMHPVYSGFISTLIINYRRFTIKANKTIDVGDCYSLSGGSTSKDNQQFIPKTITVYYQ